MEAKLQAAGGKEQRVWFKKHIFLPQDHGSWAFLFTPLLIGLFAGGVNWGSLFLVAGALAAFLIRQPITIAVKVWSGRRAARELRPALLWSGIYGLVGLAALAGLVALGHAYVLLLAIPGAPVFAWHLWLVSRRAERRQIGVELVATGVLALAAPAALWVGQGEADPRGWLLWLLVWLQSAASIVYAYLRLEQRDWTAYPALSQRLKMGGRALAYSTFNVGLALVLGLLQVTPLLLAVPFGVQWAETIWGTLNPAVGYKPVKIGVRQLIVTSLFTVLFIVFWA